MVERNRRNLCPFAPLYVFMDHRRSGRLRQIQDSSLLSRQIVRSIVALFTIPLLRWSRPCQQHHRTIDSWFSAVVKLFMVPSIFWIFLRRRDR